MSLRVKITAVLLILCLVSGVVAACGVSASAQGDTAGSLALHVIRTKPGVASPTLDTSIRDSVAVERLYTAALKLPLAHWIYNCAADDGVMYHLTFVGGTVAQRQMDLDASGCRFLSIGPAHEAHVTDDVFIALFTHTLGISSLDPDLPGNS